MSAGVHYIAGCGSKPPTANHRREGSLGAGRIDGEVCLKSWLGEYPMTAFWIGLSTGLPGSAAVGRHYPRCAVGHRQTLPGGAQCAGAMLQGG